MLTLDRMGDPKRHQANSRSKNRGRRPSLAKASGILLALLLVRALPATAQTSVVTQNYDTARTGANTNETILTPQNVNTNQFGKLFSYPVDGYVYAQPLYMPGLNIPGQGLHNVLFVATEHDSVYAFDADSGGAPLWQVSLLDAAHGAGAGATAVPSGDVRTDDLVPEIGITGTPVIDPATGTLYVVSKTKEGGTYVLRLHALDITTGAEQTSFNSPVEIQASVPGNGDGSSAGTLTFDPLWENQRPGLLLLNGIVYIGFGSHGDNTPFHGWILAYNATTLQQTGAFCDTPNGSAAGIWMSGTGLAADIVDPVNHPYGRIFLSTGNGTFNATTPPYTNQMNYGDDILNLDLTNGVPTVQDSFTPFNQQSLGNADEDVGSGGVVLLPDQNAAGHTHLLIQAGKEGRIYVIDRDKMGGYNSSNDAIVQEIPAAPSSSGYQINGIYGRPAYWNGNVYFWGSGDNLKAFSFANGQLSPTPTSRSAETAGFPAATPAVSASGNTGAIVWSIETSSYSVQGLAVLMAHDALNVATLLYSSNQNLSRDNPGPAVKFVVPTVVNGKVYVAAEYQVSVYGLLNGQQQTAEPVINPGSESFSPSVQVTITDSTPGATIYYTTDGSTPTISSTQYARPITVTSTETINAFATAASYTPSSMASATYTLQTQAQMPTFSPAPGTYSSSQSVSVSDAAPNATIYYTTDGSTPTTSSTRYTGPITVSTTTTLNAIASAPNYTQSAVASATYTIQIPQAATPTFNPPGGSYLLPQSVTISDSTPNATIYYTTDGSTPTTSSRQYTGPITVIMTTTIRAIAVGPGYSASFVGGATYTYPLGL